MKAWYQSFQTRPPQETRPPTKPQETRPPLRVSMTPQQLVTPKDFPPLPSSSIISTTPVHSPTRITTPLSSSTKVSDFDSSTACDVESYGCASGLDHVSIGNNSTTSHSRPEASAQQIPTSTHPMITRAKADITKPNPRYCLLT